MSGATRLCHAAGIALLTAAWLACGDDGAGQRDAAGGVDVRDERWDLRVERDLSGVARYELSVAARNDAEASLAEEAGVCGEQELDDPIAEQLAEAGITGVRRSSEATSPRGCRLRWTGRFASLAGLLANSFGDQDFAVARKGGELRFELPPQAPEGEEAGPSFSLAFDGAVRSSNADAAEGETGLHWSAEQIRERGVSFALVVADEG